MQMKALNRRPVTAIETSHIGNILAGIQIYQIGLYLSALPGDTLANDRKSFGATKRRITGASAQIIRSKPQSKTNYTTGNLSCFCCDRQSVPDPKAIYIGPRFEQNDQILKNGWRPT